MSPTFPKLNFTNPLMFQVWFQNRRAKFRRNERSCALNRGASAYSAKREMEASLPLRPIRISHANHAEENSADSPLLQSSQLSQYNPYNNEYWRSSAQPYATGIPAATNCHGHGFSVGANLGGNMGLSLAPPPSSTSSPTAPYPQSADNSSSNTFNAFRFRSHPYGNVYSAMHASM